MHSRAIQICQGSGRSSLGKQLKHSGFSRLPCSPSVIVPQTDRGVSSRRRCRVQAGGPSDVFVLDFDGVLVDSEPEVSRSGYNAAEAIWPDLFGKATAERKAEVLDRMRAVRPRLVSGYETVVMARLLFEDPSNAERILEDWESLLPASIASWQPDKAVIKDTFDELRMKWMTEGEDTWLKANKVYPGVGAALNAAHSPFYIVSSKAAVRVAKQMTHLFGIDIPEGSPRLFAAMIPPNEKKIEAIRTIMQRPVVAETNAMVHFVDDRCETVIAVSEAFSDQKQLQVYMADWGYNTDAEKKGIKAVPGVRSISLTQFIELVKWGFLMGVDDGCQEEGEL